MTTETPAGRASHWLVDLTAGAGIALIAITVAHAALPHRADTRPAAAPVLRAAQQLSTSTSAAAVTPAVLVAFSDPVPGRDVVSPFGLRQLPWEPVQGRLHAGIDIAADSGTPVLAVADGVVTAAGQDAGYGRYVQVKHATGLSSFYAHMGAVDQAMKPGAPVKAGTVVGRVGSTGSSTGAHLHLEIRDGKGRPLNPELFLHRSFTKAADLPLKEAAHVPEGVRVAYVSNIPANRLAQMAERAGQPLKGSAAANALDAGMNATVVVAADGRPRARFNF